MVYITGDTHRDFSRLYKLEENNDDMLIVLGDAGINYYLNEEDIRYKEYLKKFKLRLFCIRGNHEERPENIKTYKEINLFAGIMYQEKNYPNLLFFKDSEIYTILNKKVLVIGGAFSVNKDLMIERGYKWFKDEQPSELIKKQTLNNLKENNYQVDYILSHTCPYKYLPYEMFYVGVNQDKVDQSTEKFLDLIEELTDYHKWYCGHFHTDKVVDKINFMFEGYKTLD